MRGQGIDHERAMRYMLAAYADGWECNRGCMFNRYVTEYEREEGKPTVRRRLRECGVLQNDRDPKMCPAVFDDIKAA